MRRIVAILLFVAVLLALASSAMAMRSDNYWLDWYVMLTGAGSGKTASDSYAANFTVGQSGIGASASSQYGVGLGYWYGVDVKYSIYLPLILRAAP